MINAKGYDRGEQILFDLQAQPEMTELLSDTGSRITVNVRNYVDGGFDGEIGDSYNCSEYCGRFSHINIKKMNAEQQRGALIFELTNLANRPKFALVEFELRKKTFKTAEAYAKAKESIEFQGVVRTLEIERNINQRLGIKWVDSKFSNVPKKIIAERDFEAYYVNHLDDSHKNYYRKRWHKKMGVPSDSNYKQITLLVLGTLIAAIGFWKSTS